MKGPDSASVRRCVSTVAVCLLVVLAGCSWALAPTAPEPGTATDAAGEKEVVSPTTTPSPTPAPVFSLETAPETLTAGFDWAGLEALHVESTHASGGASYQYTVDVRPGPPEAETEWDPDSYRVRQWTDWDAGESNRQMENLEGQVDRFEFYNTPETRYAMAVVETDGGTHVKDTDLTDDRASNLILPTSNGSATGAEWVFPNVGTYTWAYMGKATMDGEVAAHYELVAPETTPTDHSRPLGGQFILTDDGIVTKYRVTYYRSETDEVVTETFVLFPGPADVPTPDWLGRATDPNA